MDKFLFLIFGTILMLWSCYVSANTCPDPQKTSLKWGVPPAPWLANPLSPKLPKGGESTFFLRTNILTVGYGRGITCSYKALKSEFSIWWPVAIKEPPPGDTNWISTLGGFLCTQKLEQCHFFVAYSD